MEDDLAGQGYLHMTRKDDERLSEEHDLLEKCLHLRGELTDPEAKRYLYHGFTQRLMMLQAGRINLLRDADPDDRTPRGTFVATELAIQANAYYLNIRGALDDLAWCVTHEWDLFPGISDDSGRRKSIDLFGEEFLKKVEAVRPSLSAQLQDGVPWAKDFATRRDPAAHRIPLQVPRTISSEEDAKSFQELEEKASALIKSRRVEEGFAILHEQSRLGSFYPLLVQAGADGPRPVALHDRVGRDHDEMLKVSKVVLEELHVPIAKVA